MNYIFLVDVTANSLLDLKIQIAATQGVWRQTSCARECFFPPKLKYIFLENLNLQMKITFFLIKMPNIGIISITHRLKPNH